MPAANDEFHCYVCDAAVSEREIHDGWCDNCGKKLPASYRETLRRRAKEAAPAPVSLDISDSAPASLKRRLVVGGVVVALGVLAVLAVYIG
jgi:hypothetical protein